MIARWLLVTLLAGCGTVLAESPKAAIQVTHAWTRTTVPGQAVSAAYMHISSNAKVRLLKVATTAAGLAEIHRMQMKDGVMHMAAVDAIAVGPGQAAELRPGGYHVMLMQLKRPIKAGDAVPLTLTFENADRTIQTLEVVAKGLAQAPAKAP